VKNAEVLHLGEKEEGENRFAGVSEEGEGEGGHTPRGRDLDYSEEKTIVSGREEKRRQSSGEGEEKKEGE